jgi:predicted CxxxxCH...CXXCH cytochrome family protein
MRHAACFVSLLLRATVAVSVPLLCSCGDESPASENVPPSPSQDAEPAVDSRADSFESGQEAAKDAPADKDVAVESDAADGAFEGDASEADALEGGPKDAADAEAAVESGPDALPQICTSCHGDPSKHEAAPPVDTHGNSETTFRGVGAHQAHRKALKADQKVAHAPIPCQTCHNVPGDVKEVGHIDSTPGAEVTFTGLALAKASTPDAWESNVATSCKGVYCHGAKTKGGALTQPAWTKVDGTQAACGTCHGAPPAQGHPASKKCHSCHNSVVANCPDDDPSHCVFQDDLAPDKSYLLHVDGQVQVAMSGGCTGCHGAPPANGAHAVHAAGADPPTAYGSLEPRANATSYAFNCGFCHPLDGSKHMNGTVEVELYSAQAPQAPIDPNAAADRRAVKRENAAAAYAPGTTSYSGDIAGFTNGTCSKVYCHSEQLESPASVPMPSGGQAPLKFAWKSVDAFMNASANVCCTGTTDDYPDFDLPVTRAYRTPKWVGETHTGPDQCAHCHGYPPRSGPPDNMGAGDSHAWMEPPATGGWEGGHFYNHGAGEPLQCRRCHKSTVTADLPPSSWHYAPPKDTTVFDAAMVITGFGAHVNGKKDVAFDLSPAGCSAQKPDLPYKAGGIPCLVKATYDPAARACSNVECHLKQTKVVWGSPYRPNVTVECNGCHQY